MQYLPQCLPFVMYVMATSSAPLLIKCLSAGYSRDHVGQGSGDSIFTPQSPLPLMLASRTEDLEICVGVEQGGGNPPHCSQLITLFRLSSSICFWFKEAKRNGDIANSGSGAKWKNSE